MLYARRIVGPAEVYCTAPHCKPPPPPPPPPPPLPPPLSLQVRLFSCMKELLYRRLGSNVLRILNLVVLFAILSHCIACLWYLFGVIEGFGINDWVNTERSPPPISPTLPPSNNLIPRPPQVPTQRLSEEPLQRQYIESLYHALGMMTGVLALGEPETVGHTHSSCPPLS